MSIKSLKKGEFLFKENDKITALYLVQSGGVSLCLTRGKKTLELAQLGTGQIIGEQIISGATTFPMGCVATTQTNVLEIPLDKLKAEFDTSPQFMKAIIKSLSDRMKSVMNEIKSIRLEKDAAPCPEDQVAKVFGTIFHTANHKGDKSKGDRVIVDWSTMKQYSQRVMGESLKRMEQAINILVKLKLAGYEMGKDPDDPEAPEQIMKVHFLNLPVVEAFFEFYQFYYFKSGKSEFLKVDETAYLLLETFIKLTEAIEPDRYGVVSIEFTKILDHCKNELGINLNNDHFTRLEQKGVYTKRRTVSDQVLLQFEKKEFINLLMSWRILREIDKWNEKGFVDPDEKEAKPKKRSDGPECVTCGAPLPPNAKFCAECGTKVSSAA